MIDRLATVNPRLVNAVREQEKASTVVQGAPKGTSSDEANVKKEEVQPEEEPKILKGLKNLPPALLKLMLEKEKAKQMRDMTQNMHERKEWEMMTELIEVSFEIEFGYSPLRFCRIFV